MESKNLGAKELILIIVTLALFLYIGWFLGKYKSDKKFNWIYKTVVTSYFPLQDNLSDILAKGMLAGLNDSNTFYATPEEYKKLKSTSENANIAFKKIDDRTSYLKFDAFTQNLQKELLPDLQKLSDSSDQTLIVDLRSNMGGNFESALWFLGQFINDKEVIIEKYKDQEFLHKTSSNSSLAKVKVFVVVSKETSSAAEIVAAVLQENSRAKIVGERTYGKNTIGNYFEYRDKSAIHVTTGKWVTVGGNDIGKVGVNPDIVVEHILDINTEDIVKLIQPI